MKCKQKASCKCLTWSPKDTQKGENYLRLSSHRRLQPSLPATPKGAQAVKQNRNRLLALDCWDGYKRNDSREPRLLHLPIPRKALNCLTWKIWFYLAIIFWCSDYLPFVAKLLYNLAPPLTSWEKFSQVLSRTISQVTWDAVSQACSPLKIPTE